MNTRIEAKTVNLFPNIDTTAPITRREFINLAWAVGLTLGLTGSVPTLPKRSEALQPNPLEYLPLVGQKANIIGQTTETNPVTITNIKVESGQTTAQVLIEKANDTFEFSNLPVSQLRIENTAKTRPQDYKSAAVSLKPENFYQLKGSYGIVLKKDLNTAEMLAVRIAPSTESPDKVSFFYRNPNGQLLIGSSAPDNVFLQPRTLNRIINGALNLDETLLNEPVKTMRLSEPTNFETLLQRATKVFRGERTEDWTYLITKHAESNNPTAVTEATRYLTEEEGREQIVNELFYHPAKNQP